MSLSPCIYSALLLGILYLFFGTYNSLSIWHIVRGPGSEGISSKQRAPQLLRPSIPSSALKKIIDNCILTYPKGAFPLVLIINQGFELRQTGLIFLDLVPGMLFAVAMMPFFSKNYMRLVANWKKEMGGIKSSESMSPELEFRLPPVILGAVLVPIYLFVRVTLPV